MSGTDCSETDKARQAFGGEDERDAFASKISKFCLVLSSKSDVIAFPDKQYVFQCIISRYISQFFAGC